LQVRPDYCKTTVGKSCFLLLPSILPIKNASYFGRILIGTAGLALKPVWLGWLLKHWGCAPNQSG